MSFVEPITIKDVIINIDKKNYLLPAIQREFVWDTYQIERLFDSIMRDYPISSFLFWEVDSSNTGSYQFYEFVKDYHERDNRHNPKANLNGSNGITAILDGQQRLTSLYLGLKGSYAYKLPRKRWDNNDAFPKRKLYLNLLSSTDNEDLEYDFQFLTDKEASQVTIDAFWFPVGEILNLKEEYEVNEYLINKDISSLEKEKYRFANKTLYKLHSVIHKNKTINFFLERDESLDKVLNIFIRVNSGGTQLSYSDLLLSIATAQWKHKDAKEEITLFVDEINKIGNGFNFNKDFVLKSCLVLSGIRDIAFKVDNFNQANMVFIENMWDDISKAIKSVILLISSLGYHRDTLPSNNALIPIAYYLLMIKSPNNFAESSTYSDDRKKIFKFIISVLLKRTFSGQPDNVLRPLRDIIKSNHDKFPLDDIIQKLRRTSKAIIFTEDEIDNLFFYQYGQSYTFSCLALLYPSLDFRNRFHQDHIFPKSLFTKKNLEKYSLTENEVDFFFENYNCLANLQLLEGVQNQEKSNTDFNSWLYKKYPEEADKRAYMEKHYIPNIDLSLCNFKEFILKRKEKLKNEFKKMLIM